MSCKKIAIVNDLNFVKENLNSIRKISDSKGLKLIALSDAPFLYLKSKAVNCISHRDLESDNMYKNVYDTAKEWGVNWYNPKGEDFTSSDLLSLGNVAEWFMIYFFSNFLRIYLSIKQIISSLKPDEITLFTTKELDLAKDLPQLQYVDICLLRHVLDEYVRAHGLRIKFHTLEYSYPDEEKRDNFIRPLCSLLNNVLSEAFKLGNSIISKDKKILFFEGSHHFSEIMKTSELKDFQKIHLQKRIGLSLIPELYSNNIRVATLKKNKNYNDIDKKQFALEKIKGLLKGFFMYQHEDLLLYLWPRLEYLLAKFFPEVLYPEVISVFRALKRIRPDCVVTENDTTYHEKTVVLAAKKLNIPTVVIQHGTTFCDDELDSKGLVFHDFFPLTSDKFFAFGEATKKWFKDMGVSEERIIVTGASRFDRYYRGKSDKRICASRNEKKVLIILNDLWEKEGVITHHMGLDVIYDHLKEFVEIARKNPKIRFIVRSHDKNNQWKELLQAQISDLDNFLISHQGSLEKALEDTDLVIGYHSTALVEALIVGLPVISIDSGRFYNMLPLWKYRLSKRVTTFDILGEEIHSLLCNEQRCQAQRKEVDDKLHLFNYNNDGRATHRIACELKKIVSKNACENRQG